MPDGSTYREHLLAVERTGIDTGELVAPDPPPGADALLNLFWTLYQSAGSTGFGKAAIKSVDIVAWQQLVGVTLLPSEVDVIFFLDNVAQAATAEK